jgi:CheY-like chemotaxis protein
VCDYRILDEICSLMLLHRARELRCNGRILPTHAGSHLKKPGPSPLEKLNMSPVEPAAPPRGLRVLVVDDNQDAADALARLLSIWGHQCRCAYDAPDAFEAALEQRPDVVLSDLAMPHVEGTGLARMIRQQGDEPIPLLVAVTAHGDDDHRQEALAAGFDHFLVKPVNGVELKSVLDEYAVAAKR